MNDLLVSYSWYRFYKAKPEICRILKQFGDEQPLVEKTPVMGIALVHTCLDNREVIKQCHELFKTDFTFMHAIKWLPVDYWCQTDLDIIRKLIEDKIANDIGDNETWGMVVKKRRWQKYHSREIIEHLAPVIQRRVNLSNPEKIVWIDVIGNQTAVSLLRPEDIFSINVTALS